MVGIETLLDGEKGMGTEREEKMNTAIDELSAHLFQKRDAKGLELLSNLIKALIKREKERAEVLKHERL